MNRERRRRAERKQRPAREVRALPGWPPAPTVVGDVAGLTSASALADGQLADRTAARSAERARRRSQRPAHPPLPISAAELRTTVVGCGALEGVPPQALGVTYGFDPPREGNPLAVTVQFDGVRRITAGRAGPRDRFSVRETAWPVLPGSGRVSITARVIDIAAGEWIVTAFPVHPKDGERLGEPVVVTGATAFGPVVGARAPGVRLGAWPALVSLGAVLAVALQVLLAGRAGLPMGPVLAVSLIACLVGLVGARLYFVVENPHAPRGLMRITTGLCVQGFVLAATGAVAAGAWLTGLPLGIVLDATAPGLLFGMAIGRLGCFLGGCCTGRPTASRFGVWCSDRRLGVRRIPTQLIEAAIALGIGLAALSLEWVGPTLPYGGVFVVALAAYTLGRQMVFPYRSVARRSPFTSRVIAGICIAVIFLAAAWPLLPRVTP